MYRINVPIPKNSTMKIAHQDRLDQTKFKT